MLWVDSTTSKNAIAQTPFLLVFKTEVMIPPEMVITTVRSCLQNLETNYRDLVDDLDTIDELRDSAKLLITTYQQRITRHTTKVLE